VLVPAAHGLARGLYTSATVHHVGGGALGYGSPRKTYLNFRNSLAVLTKHLRSRFIVYRIFHRLVLDVFAAMKFIAEGHARHAWQVFRAHRHFLLRLPTPAPGAQAACATWSAIHPTSPACTAAASLTTATSWAGRNSPTWTTRIDQPPRRSKYSTASR
jgi:hypothetical protein